MSGNYSLLFLICYPIIGALVSYLVGRYHKAARDYVADFIVITEFLCFVVLFKQVGVDGMTMDFVWKEFCGMGLHISLDGFRVLYGTIAAFMWMMTTIFSKEYFKHYRNRNRYYLFNLLTLGATVGVFLSANLYTTFIFFEIMSFTSYVWVAHDERKESMRAAETYLAIAIIGGLVMLMGLFLLYDAIGTLEMSQLLAGVQAYSDRGRIYAAGLCLLFGFAAKAGAFPLHIWLPKAHPVAPAPASALLSGILTKAGIFGILVISCNIFLYDKRWGLLIVALGVLTMVGGAILALFGVDLKRILACSSMSQIGFILIGIGMQCLLGMDNGLAVRGSLLHMVNHSLIKLVLFMAAGVVFMNIHALNLNQIRGFGHKKPLLNFAFLMGALGIGGIPLWNGYISKTLIHESIVAYITQLEVEHLPVMIPLFHGVENLFLFSGGLTIAYMAKIYIALFIEKNSNKQKQAEFDAMSQHYMNNQSRFALLISAVILPIMGCFSGLIMNNIADMGEGFMHLKTMEENVNYYSMTNLQGGAISIAIGIILYCLIVRVALMDKDTEEQPEYCDLWPSWLDLEDLIYRPLLLKVFPMIFGTISRVFDSMLDSVVVLLRKTIYRNRKIPHELSEGTVITHAIGVAMDDITEVIQHVPHNSRSITESYVHRIAVKREELRENEMIIKRSMSFGLFMFCLGLCVTLIYILFLK
ncbi:MAG: complex I subunit 5 family protein [Lachnospiraceae bacterium]